MVDSQVILHLITYHKVDTDQFCKIHHHVKSTFVYLVSYEHHVYSSIDVLIVLLIPVVTLYLVYLFDQSS